MKTLIDYTVPVGGLLVTEAGRASKRIVGHVIRTKVREEASVQSDKLQRNIRNAVIFTLCWQNLLLIAAILLSYRLKSTSAFYGAYSFVLLWNLVEMIAARAYISMFITTRSLFAVINAEVGKSIRKYLDQAGHFERWVLEALGPDLDELALEATRHIYPSIKAFLYVNLATVITAFVVFRLWLIPQLSKALL